MTIKNINYGANETFVKKLNALIAEKGFPTNTEFAKWLGIPRQILSMMKTGYRPPTRNVLDQLILRTGKPEEYWLYDIDIEDTSNYANTRQDFKMLRKAIDDILDCGFMDLNGEYTSKENEICSKKLLEYALSSDIEHILVKKREDIKKTR